MSMTALSLWGCSLPENQAQPEPPIAVLADHWLDSPHVDEYLTRQLTAYTSLDDAFLSIASRIYLIRHAKQHIDLQYYIWKNDFIGQLMLAELLKAADRGVKIRLLLDDQNETQLDHVLRALAQHPNFQIKLFNPYMGRHFRAYDYLFRFEHTNRRMHNKLIIADGAIAVTGGRNISSEYFDASYDFQFADMDILFYGTAVRTANQVFREFWNDPLSYSVQQWLEMDDSMAIEKLRAEYTSLLEKPHATNEQLKKAEKRLAVRLKSQNLRWAKAHFVADSPEKIRGQAQDQQLIYHQMIELMGFPAQHMELVSAYFVPTEFGTQYLSQFAKSGVKIRVLTNSFMANDVAVVHAYYQQYRIELLKNGVELYEFKHVLKRNKRSWYEIATGHVIPPKNKNSSSLHAKFFDVDGKVFIGSFNFDPRSAHLNTEVGLVVESDELQKQISQNLDHQLPKIAYQVKLNEQGELIWLEQKPDGQVKIHQQEPEMTAFQRWIMILVSYLPFEWMM